MLVRQRRERDENQDTINRQYCMPLRFSFIFGIKVHKLICFTTTTIRQSCEYKPNTLHKKIDLRARIDLSL